MNFINHHSSEINHPLDFATIFNLSFIFSEISPIHCAKCGGRFVKSTNKYIVCRNISNKKNKCKNITTFIQLKGYLIDLYNHRRVRFNPESNKLIFKLRRQKQSILFSSPYSEDFENKNLQIPIKINLKEDIFNPKTLRLHFKCQYDYFSSNTNPFSSSPSSSSFSSPSSSSFYLPSSSTKSNQKNNKNLLKNLKFEISIISINDEKYEIKKNNKGKEKAEEENEIISINDEKYEIKKNNKGKEKAEEEENEMIEKNEIIEENETY
eukprot:jgi/Orpsp1_1/1190159/evm.model.d7180000077091.1